MESSDGEELLFCRFCLRQSQSSFPIFMASDPDLANDVMNCLQIKISPDSIGPRHICNECYDRVQDWVMFKRQSEEALKEIESNAGQSEKQHDIAPHTADLVDEVDYHCCLFCEKFFPSEYELLMHVSVMHQKIIDFDSKNADEAMEYIQSTTVCNDDDVDNNDDDDVQYDDDYLAAIINNSSSQKNNDEELTETLTSEDSDEKFQCYYCNATFDEFIQLKDHSVSRHRDLNKKTECNRCNKIFLTVSDLQEHVRLTHPTKKDRYDQSDSMALRTPKRLPYVCNLCNSSFSRFCDLLDHDEIQHDDLPKRYRCRVCSKMFLLEDRAKVHYNFYHTKTKGTMNFQCSYCDMELKSASAVANHERMHITQNSTQSSYKVIRD